MPSTSSKAEEGACQAASKVPKCSHKCLMVTGPTPLICDHASQYALSVANALSSLLASLLMVEMLLVRMLFVRMPAHTLFEQLKLIGFGAVIDFGAWILALGFWHLDFGPWILGLER